MSATPSEILQALLIQQGIFGDPGASSLNWPLFDGFLPDLTTAQIPVPDSAAAVYDTTGAKDGRLMKGKNIFHPAVMFRIRAQEYDDARDKAQQVAAFLEGVFNVAVVVGPQTFVIQNCSQQQPPISNGTEPSTKRRQIFSINYLMTIWEQAPGNVMPTPVPTATQRIAVVTKTAAYAPTAADSLTEFTTAGAAAEVDFTLPPWQQGLTFTFNDASPNGLRVICSGSDHIRFGGSNSAPGGYALSGGQGSTITMTVVSPGEWVGYPSTGNWDIE